MTYNEKRAFFFFVILEVPKSKIKGLASEKDVLDLARDLFAALSDDRRRESKRANSQRRGSRVQTHLWSGTLYRGEEVRSRMTYCQEPSPEEGKSGPDSPMLRNLLQRRGSQVQTHLWSGTFSRGEEVRSKLTYSQEPYPEERKSGPDLPIVRNPL